MEFLSNDANQKTHKQTKKTLPTPALSLTQESSDVSHEETTVNTNPTMTVIDFTNTHTW